MIDQSHNTICVQDLPLAQAEDHSFRMTTHSPHTIPQCVCSSEAGADFSLPQRTPGMVGEKEGVKKEHFILFLIEIPHPVPLPTIRNQNQTHSCSLRVSFHHSFSSPSLLPPHALCTKTLLFSQFPTAAPTGMLAGLLSVFPVQLLQPLSPHFLSPYFPLLQSGVHPS